MTAAADAGFALLLERIERERGFACASYKRSCIERRVRTRMRSRGATSYESYADLLDREPREMDRLVDALTINVTRFFRNRAVWDIVAREVIPAIWSSQLETIRVWSAGCASGEEAYSIAILFHRHAAVQGMLGQMERAVITGTDVDERAVSAAERGTWSPGEITEVPADLNRYFRTETALLAPGVRRMVRFLRHDLLRDPYPIAQQHLVICRNVLIYFDRAVQQQVIARLRDSLAPGGYLILGRVESLLGTTGFERVAPKERIFRKVS